MSEGADDMLLFAAVVEAKSFTQAAKKLGLSKQAVSDRIAKLERRLGVRLLERTTRRVRPTDLGARYFSHSQVVARAVLAGEKELLSLKSEPSGTLRISVPVLYGRRFLLPIISELSLAYPALRVEAALGDDYVELVRDGFDAAIRVGAPTDRSLVAKKLGTSDIHCVASPAFLARAGTPKPETLGSFRCIGMRPTETWSFEEGLKQTIEPVLVINDLELTLDATLAGVGIARLPAFLIRRHVSGERLVALFGRPITKRSLYVVYPSREHRPPALVAFIDRLEALFEPMLPLR